MLSRTAQRLTFINALVFSLVLGVYGVSVYTLSVRRMDRDVREDLQHLWTVLESSIEAQGPNHQRDENRKIDIPEVVQLLTAREKQHSPAEAIQWFNLDGNLLAETGPFRICLPLNTRATFEQQRVQQHALVFTSPVSREGQPLGYLRVAMPLTECEVMNDHLLLDMMLGTLIAAAFSGGAIFWLVRQGLKPVETSMQRLADFSMDASHELQGPVMAIKTNAAVALKYSEGMRESDREKMLSIVDAANQMSATIDALLRLADVEQILPVSDLQRVSVSELFAELSNELKGLADSKSIDLNMTIDQPNLSLKAVAADVKAALHNVTLNALMYSHEEHSVNITAAKASKFVEFRVEDFGIGIDEKELPRIFDRFWRSDRARSYRSGGRGLGLAITKNIVERYKGSIAVESTLGSGTCVTLRFPEIPQ